MPGVFISYRRDDQPGFAGRLADTLSAAFGADNVFRDIEDIRPGEDFVIALDKQLQSVDVMLVMIGPDWLGASRSGVRRLDDPGDFVRKEIEAALASGKPLLPVLVAGAAMPEESDLPPTLRALARRQAIVLSDTGWAADVTHLTAAIRAFLPRQRRQTLPRRGVWALAGISLIVLLALVLQDHVTDQSAAKTAQHLNGRWMAQVKYDWGAEHEERFEFRLENGTLHGTASYLRLARRVEQGQLQNDRLSFITRSQETLGDTPSREVTHRYRGVLVQGELRLILESTGGYSQHPPVEFVALRTAQ